MSDIGKGTTVNQSRLPFKSLHQIRLEGILEQHGHRSGDTQISGIDGLVVSGEGNKHTLQALLEIGRA